MTPVTHSTVSYGPTSAWLGIIISHQEGYLLTLSDSLASGLQPFYEPAWHLFLVGKFAELAHLMCAWLAESLLDEIDYSHLDDALQAMMAPPVSCHHPSSFRPLCCCLEQTNSNSPR